MHIFQGSRGFSFSRLSLISKAPLLAKPHLYSSNTHRASSPRFHH